MSKLKLNRIDVARNGAKAYKEKLLSAQGKFPECRYRDDGKNPCVIGASLSTRTANKWDKLEGDGSSSIEDIHIHGLFDTDDIDYLRRLQGAHDMWCQKMNPYWRNQIKQETEIFFVSVLNEALPEQEKITVNTPDKGTVV